MNASVEFPEMRAQVVYTLHALSDVEYQRANWGRYVEGVNFYDDLDLSIHVLYDDCEVLPSPAGSVGTILFGDEVPALLAVDAALGPMIRDLGDRPEGDYTGDLRWAGVVSAARAAWLLLRSNDGGGKA